MNNFFDKLGKRRDAGARVCIGLDLDYRALPESYREKGFHPGRFNYATDMVAKTRPLAFAYKLNPKFWAEERLVKLADYIRHEAPEVPILLDDKYGDVHHTNCFSASKAFDFFRADAVTVQAFPGKEALRPFLEQKDKGIFVVSRMSGDGSEEFQEQLERVSDIEAERWGLASGTMLPAYQRIAYRVSREWNEYGNCGLVVGANRPEALKETRSIIGNNMLMLTPGQGKQGGSVQDVVRNGANLFGEGVIITSARSLIYSNHSLDPIESAFDRLQRLTDRIYEIEGRKSRVHASA